MPTRTLSVVFTDIKGFTARTASSSRAELRDLLDRHEQLLLPVIHHYDGTVVKTIGDAFLLTFESPTNAVLCGLMIQETLREFNLKTAEAEWIEVRVAINTGEVEVRGNDVFGETVNIAARIEGITEAGEVYFTHATYLSMNKSEVPTSEVGERRLKGIEEPIRVYRVIQDEDLASYKTLIANELEGREQSLLEKPLFAAKRTASNKKKIFFGVAIFALALAGIFGPTKYKEFQTNRTIDNLETQIAGASDRTTRDQAFESLNALAKKNPENNDLLYRIARINGASPYWKRLAFTQIATLISRDQAYENDVTLSEILFTSLNYLDLEETGAASEDGKLRTLMAETYAEKWREKLLPMLHEFDGAEPIERRNAYLILEQSPIADEINRMRYFTIELWSEVNSGNPWNARVFDFLEAQTGKAENGAGFHWTPNNLLPKYLQYFNGEGDRVQAIVSSLFASTLQTTLQEAVVGEDLGYRLYSKKILENHARFTDVLEREFQLANLNSYWKGYTSPWVVDSVVYFGQQEPSSVGANIIEALENIAKETAEIIASGEVPDKRQDMADYQTRLDAAESTLTMLKK